MASFASAGTPYEADAPSPLSRVLLTFTAPSRAFTRLGAGGSWWLPFLLVVLVSLSYMAAVGARVGWEAVARNNLAASPRQQARFDQTPAAQQASSLALIARITRTSAYAVSLVGPLAFGSLVAGLLLATFRFGFGGKGTFGALFAVYQYSVLPQAVKLLLVILTLFLGIGGDAFQISNPLGSNPAYYLQGAPRAILSLLSWIDLFALWQIALLILGSAAVTGLKRSAAATAVLGWTLLFALGGAGLALL